MLLTQGYTNSAICSPTRTALLSGKYQYRFPLGLPEPVGPGTEKDIGYPMTHRLWPQNSATAVIKQY